MSKVEKETPQALSAKLTTWWNSAQNGRKELDWKWFNYDVWVAGYSLQ